MTLKSLERLNKRFTRLREIFNRTKIKSSTLTYESIKKKFNSLPLKEKTRVSLKIPIVRISRNDIEELNRIVFVFSGSGLRGLAYVPIVEKLKQLNIKHEFSIGSSGGCLAALGLESNISRDLFFTYMDFAKFFNRIDNTFKLVREFLKNGGAFLIKKDEVVEALKGICVSVDVNSNSINRFFGVSSIYKSHLSLLFGRYSSSNRNLEINMHIDLWDLVYSSMSAPVSFEAFKSKEKDVLLYDYFSEEFYKKRFDNLVLYDGASSSPMPLEEALAITKTLFGSRALRTTLFILFNLVSEISSAENRRIKAKEVFNDFVQSNLTNSLIKSLLLSREKTNILLFNVNFDGSLNDIWFSDIKRIEEILRKGESFNLYLENFFKS